MSQVPLFCSSMLTLFRHCHGRPHKIWNGTSPIQKSEVVMKFPAVNSMSKHCPFRFVKWLLASHISVLVQMSISCPDSLHVLFPIMSSSKPGSIRALVVCPFLNLTFGIMWIEYRTIDLRVEW